MKPLKALFDEHQYWWPPDADNTLTLYSPHSVSGPGHGCSREVPEVSKTMMTSVGSECGGSGKPTLSLYWEQPEHFLSYQLTRRKSGLTGDKSQADPNSRTIVGIPFNSLLRQALYTLKLFWPSRFQIGHTEC